MLSGCVLVCGGGVVWISVFLCLLGWVVSFGRFLLVFLCLLFFLFCFVFFFFFFFFSGCFLLELRKKRSPQRRALP